MELKNKLCESCGGDLRQISEEQYKCEFCRYVYDSKEVMRYADKLHKLLDELKIEAISNARRNLYEAVNAEYVSSKRVHECCVILKQLLPDDFQANFYEVAVGNNVVALTKAIRRIDVRENGVYVDGIINFLLRSLKTEYQLELNNLIARAYEKTEPAKFEEYCTRLAAEAVKVDAGVYETRLPREVFVAYSSKDMDAVSELTEALESQGLKCFVAARNLRHGKGAVENYNRALEEAMDHCRSIVFVSSVNSRSFNCDALTVELPYIQKKDTENAPAEYKNNYKAMPQQYKKPRVEYRIGESVQNNVADVISNEIFDGYERAYSPEEVAARVMKQLVAAPAAAKKEEPPKVKYCISCFAECQRNAKFCSSCGGKEFADSKTEAELKKQILALEQQKAELEKAKNSVLQLEVKGEKSVPTPKKEELLKYCVSCLKESPREAKFCSYCGKSEFAGTQKEAEQKKQIRTSEKQKTEFEKVKIPTPQLEAKKENLAKREGNSIIPKTNIPSSKGLEFELDYDGCSYSVVGIGTCKDTTVVIPSTHRGKSVTCIDDSAFDGCECLESITIPDSVTSIGDSAFSGCECLESITIPDSVTSIGMSAFSGCYSLASITIPDGVTSIGSFAFSGCALGSITIPDGVTSISDYAFEDCVCLESITIPDSATSIGDSAFSGCDSLESITMPNSVTSIGDSAFYGCSSLTSITIPDSVMSIDSFAFSGCDSLESITIPNSVTSIGHSVFEDCSSLTSIHIPDSVTSIDDWTFQNCSSLTSVTIPDSVTSIGDSAFSGCDSLESITIPNSVTSIGDSAFEDCGSLTSIHIPDSVKSIGKSAFSGCDSLESLIILATVGWQEEGGISVPKDILKDPWEAANALKTTYLETGISRR